MKMRTVCMLLAIVTLAAQGLFAADSDFTFDAATGTITGYSGWDTELAIPAAIGGKPVKVIGKEAFKGAGLTSVTIPAGVTEIGDDAFNDNKLTAVTIPGSVGIIGNSAFSDNQLTTLVIPEGVKELRSGAFKYNKITSVTLPSTLEYFISNLFDDYVGSSQSPTTYTLAANINIDFGSSVQGAVWYNYIANGRKAGTYTADMRCDWETKEDYYHVKTQYGVALVDYKGRSNRIRVPAELDGMAVTAIGNVYNRKDIANLLIPEGITYIGTGAFNGCGLTAVTIPSSVTYIGDDAFSSNKLTAVTIPAGVTGIGSSAFSLNQLTTVVIPPKVTYLGINAFARNQLTGVTIPASVAHIRNDTFEGNKLASVTLPEGVTRVDANAFSDNAIATLTLPASLVHIEGSAFGKNKLKTLNIPAGVRYIGKGAFADSETTLTAVTVAAGVTYIGKEAFGKGFVPLPNLPKLSVTIPSTVTVIGGTPPIPAEEGNSFVLQSAVKNEGYSEWEGSGVLNAQTLKAGRYTFNRRSGWVYSPK